MQMAHWPVEILHTLAFFTLFDQCAVLSLFDFNSIFIHIKCLSRKWRIFYRNNFSRSSWCIRYRQFVCSRRKRRARWRIFQKRTKEGKAWSANCRREQPYLSLGMTVLFLALEFFGISFHFKLQLCYKLTVESRRH